MTCFFYMSAAEKSSAERDKCVCGVYVSTEILRLRMSSFLTYEVCKQGEIKHANKRVIA